jgi:hypothetical protein
LQFFNEPIAPSDAIQSRRARIGHWNEPVTMAGPLAMNRVLGKVVEASDIEKVKHGNALENKFLTKKIGLPAVTINTQ